MTLLLTLTQPLLDVRLFHQTLDRFFQEERVPFRAANDLRLAASEALANVIEHAFFGRLPKPVEIVLTRDGNALICRITDEGTPFDPVHVPLPPSNEGASLENYRIGGLGLRLIREKADELAYCRVKDRNQLTLVKRLS